MFCNERPLAIAIFFLELVIISLFTSCIDDDNENCSNGKKMIHLQILPEWEGQMGLPEGIRVTFYSLKTHKYVQDNYLAKGGYSDIREGNYQLIMYNNDSEKIRFRNVDTYDAHEAFTNQISRPSYQSPVSGEETYAQPDMLWLDRINEFDISSRSAVIRFKPRQMVKLYSGRVEVEGLEHVQEVRGAVTGIIGSLNLSSGKSNEPATLFFDAGIRSDSVYFNFRSFGTFYTKSTPIKHYLVLEFLLPKGIVQRNIEITHQMDSLLNGGYIKINTEISVPPDTTGTDGGFNANVGDWKEIIYPIPI